MRMSYPYSICASRATAQVTRSEIECSWAYQRFVRSALMDAKLCCTTQNLISIESLVLLQAHSSIQHEVETLQLKHAKNLPTRSRETRPAPGSPRARHGPPVRRSYPQACRAACPGPCRPSPATAGEGHSRHSAGRLSGTVPTLAARR